MAPRTATLLVGAAAAAILYYYYLRRRRTLTLWLQPRAISPSEICIGAIWMAPGGGPNGDGDRPDPGHENAVATVTTAIKAGVREFDTAPWYGSGSSEERLGRALKEAMIKLPNASIKVTTKIGRLVRSADGKPCGPGFDEPGTAAPLATRRFLNSYTAAGAEVSHDESLKRLSLGKVHALRVHDPNDNNINNRNMASWVDEVGIAINGEDGCCAALRKMREKGTITEVGLGMNVNREAHQGVPDEVIRLIRGVPTGTFDSALLAGGWNLLSQAGLPAFVECERRGIAVHVAGVFASGLLVGGETYAYKQAPSEMVRLATQWKRLADEYGHELPSVAIAFASLPMCVTRIVLGMASPEQVEQNLKWVAGAAKVEAALFHEAKRRGLLAEEVPLV